MQLQGRSDQLLTQRQPQVFSLATECTLQDAGKAPYGMENSTWGGGHSLAPERKKTGTPQTLVDGSQEESVAPPAVILCPEFCVHTLSSSASLKKSLDESQGTMIELHSCLNVSVLSSRTGEL